MFKLMMIIAGEAFRDGGQHSRKRDTDFGYAQQKIATETHIQLIEKLKNEGVDIDLYIESYTSKYSQDLIKWYSKCIDKDNIYYQFHNQLFKDGRSELCTKCIRKYNIDKYDAIFIIRPDMYLKPYFLKIFNIEYDKITYPNRILWRHNEITVNDMMLYIPKKFISLLQIATIKLLHRAIPQYTQTPNFKINDFGFMIPTIHDSDSEKDYNPMYWLISRINTKNWKFYGYEVDTDNILNTIFTNKLYVFDDWNIYHNIDINIQKQIININNVYEWFHMVNNFRYLYQGIMEFDIHNKVDHTIKLWAGPDQSLCQIENNQLVFYNYEHMVTSRHTNINGSWCGKFLHKPNVDFLVRPLVR